MTELVSTAPAIEISTDTIVEVETALPNLQVNTSESITVEVQPDTYVLSSAGMYTGNMTGKVPTWILDAIQEQLTTGDGNIASVLDDIQLLLNGLQLGVNQAISQIENTNTSMSALETSLKSKIDANNAAILDVYATRVTATEAQAVAVQAIGSTFGGNVDAYIGNLASTYTNADSATATNIRTLQASYNEQTTRLDTVEYVKTGLSPEWDGISTPTIGEYKEANGVFYTYVGGTLGEFGDGWMLSKSSPYTYADTAVSVLEESTGISIEELRNQIDGVIDSWYYNYVPDQTKEPWSTWIAIDTANGNTNEQIAHSGDLFYDLTTGTAYRFSLSGSVYGWAVITDTSITLALQNSSTAQYTADGKSSVYYSEAVPIPKIVNGTSIPIKQGDLWIKISTGVAKVALIDNATVLGSWGNITNTATENALLSLVDLEEARDGSIVVYYLTATGLATGMTYGDYLVDTDSWDGTNYVVYRYENSTGGSSGTLAWYTNTGEVARTLSNGYKAQNTADSKIKTWYQPSTPMGLTANDIGDMWIDTDNANTLQIWSGTDWVDTSNKAAIDAQKAANTANSLLADIASDSKLVATEKQQVKKEWDIIVSEKSTYVTQAGTFGVSTTSYVAAYDALNAYLNVTIITPNITPLLASLTATSDIDSATFRSTFGTYYTARTALLNSIATATKTIADNARNGVLHNAVNASPPTATGLNDVWLVTDLYYTANTGTGTSTSSVITTIDTTVTPNISVNSKAKNAIKIWNGSTWVLQAADALETKRISWVGGASKLLYGPDGGITGWEFANGSGLQSEFKINAQKFSISDGITGYTPFSINGSNIVFNGRVSFNSVTSAPTSTPNSTFPGLNIGTGYTVTKAGAHVVYLYGIAATTIAVEVDGSTVGSTALNKQVAVLATPALSIGQVLTISASGGTVVAYVSNPDAIAATVPGTQWYIPAYNTTLVAGSNKRFVIGSSSAIGDIIKGINGTTNTTTIDGGRITTGSITANQIAANSITSSQIAANTITADRFTSTTGQSSVWTGGGLVSQNFNGNVVGSIGNPTQGFRLSSNAVGTSSDPNIYGAYIKGATLEGTTMSTSDIKVVANGYPSNFGPIMLSEIYGGGSSLVSSIFRNRAYSFGYHSKRMCSTSQTFVLQAVTGGGFSIYGSVTTTCNIYVSVNGGGWVLIASNSGTTGLATCSITYVVDSLNDVQFMSTHSSNAVQSSSFSIQSINGQ